jgi:hypothetical protein
MAYCAIAMGAVSCVFGPFVLMWLWLFISLMPLPLPWLERNAPLPALHVAAAAGDVEAIDRCLQAGDSIDLQAYGCPKWPDGTTALMIAAHNGDIETAEAILDRGANIGLVDIRRAGYSAIHYASPAAVALLVDRGADINAKTAHGQTPLMIAAIRARDTQDFNGVRLLIDIGADVNARDNEGRTAIGVLRTWPRPNLELIKVIEEAGGK